MQDIHKESLYNREERTGGLTKMPNITFYVDNDLYVDFLKLSDGERMALRQRFKDEVQETINQKKVV